LSKNPSATNILKKNIDKIYLSELSRNTNMKVINFLDQNTDIINWKNLLSNSSANKILKNNPEKIILFYFCCNPLLFKKN
jgi:hypothetical protein